MAVADDENVAVIQASLRGKNSRREQSNKQVAHAIANSNADELSRLLSKGAKPVAEALQQAIGSGVPALAEMLVRERSAWGIDAKQLAVWAKVQDAIAAAADEDNDEDVDVTSEEWQASVAEEVWAGADEAALADAKYVVRQVVELGCYAGERASAPEAYEPTFDSEVLARHGYGVALLPKGEVYAGHFAGGARDGVGIVVHVDGSTYYGAWKAGKKHGGGRMAYTDGSVYDGAWKYNKRHGDGLYKYANGDRYVGAWYTGSKHGKGKYISAAGGVRTTGVWADGKLLKGSCAGPDDSFFTSSAFADGAPQGPAAFCMRGGAVVEGMHPSVSSVDDDDDDAAALSRTLQWAGGEAVQADRTTKEKLEAKYVGRLELKPKKRALVVAPDYKLGEAYPHIDLQPAATSLASLLGGRLGFDAPTVLDADQGTKERLDEEVEKLSSELGRGDVAVIALLCHGKKLLDLDNAELEEQAEGLCLADEVIGNDEIAEIIAKFTAKSIRLFLWIDGVFAAPCISTPPPNFVAVTGGLQADAAPAEGGNRWSAYYEHNMTSWLCQALEARAADLSCADLHSAVIGSQVAADTRPAVRQSPALFCLDPAEPALEPLA